MLVTNINPFLLIAAIVIAVITVVEWRKRTIGLWAVVVGVTLTVLFLLMVNYQAL